MKKLEPAIEEYVTKLQEQLESETNEEKRKFIEQQIQTLCGYEQDDDIDIPEKAKKHIEMLEDIHYKIDEFIDLYLHGEIRSEAEKEEKSVFVKEEKNREYITTELVLERAIEEIDNAIESIRRLYASEMF